MANSDFSSTVILGAGLAGIGCARQLPGSRVFEAKPYVGGHGASHRWEGFSFDEGAHISHTTDPTFLALVGASTRADIVSVNNQTANWDRGRWLPYPIQNHLHELPVDERIKALTGFVRAQSEKHLTPVNYHEWCLQQYGEYLTETYYRRYTEKYWRTVMSEMDTDWMSGRLLPSQVDRVIAGSIAAQKETQPVFSKFRYPRDGGFMALIKPIFEGIRVTLNETATAVDHKKKTVRFASQRIESYQHLVSTIPLPLFIEMMADVPSDVREAAATLRWTQLICVNFVVAKSKAVPWHWFYIYDQDIEAARVSVASNLSESTCNVTAFQAEIFRRNDESVDLEKIETKAVEQLEGILGLKKFEIAAVQTKLVPFGYVVPCLGHALASSHVIDWLKREGIEMAGLFGCWKYMWSDAAFRSGEVAAENVKAHC